MALKNPQYNAIIRQYDQLQLANNRQLEDRQQEIYKAIPDMSQLDAQIAQTAASYAKQAILSPKNHSKEQFRQDMALLDARKRELLVAHGFDPNYLEPTYHCPDCKDTGFIGNEKCHCFKQAIVDLVYSQSNIRKRLEKENFETFSLNYYSETVDRRLGISPRDNIKNVLSACMDFINNFDKTDENLLFYGTTGVGKTFLSNCIAKELLDQAHTVIYLTAFELVDILEKNTFGRDDENDIPENMFSYCLDCDLLIVDDLGTELNNSFVTSQLFLCINERLLNHKSTIISTNYSPEELKRAYSERISSRIISNYTVLPIFGEDIRVKKAIMG